MFKSTEERWKLVKKKNLCHNCLTSGHKKSDCRSQQLASSANRAIILAFILMTTGVNRSKHISLSSIHLLLQLLHPPRRPRLLLRLFRPSVWLLSSDLPARIHRLPMTSHRSYRQQSLHRQSSS